MTTLSRDQIGQSARDLLSTPGLSEDRRSATYTNCANLSEVSRIALELAV
jgi:hypothetical protein